MVEVESNNCVVEEILNSAEIDNLIASLREGRKYRSLHLPEDTLRDLLLQELPRHRNRADALQSVRRKLHNLVAPYLGDPNYEKADQNLRSAFQRHEQEEIKTLCSDLLNSHASTRERQPILVEFYSQIFAFTGKPQVILDLACGMNPFAFPWMGLDKTVKYYAYDIHQPRVNLINTFFEGWGLQTNARQQDILVEPPQVKADVAFFFKEAHRFEQRLHGCNRNFWQRLNARYLLVSLPTENLTGQHSLLERQRKLVAATLQGLDWKVSEILFSTEIVFCIQPTAPGVG